MDIIKGINDFGSVPETDMKRFNDSLGNKYWLDGLLTTAIKSISSKIDWFIEREKGIFQSIISPNER